VKPFGEGTLQSAHELMQVAREMVMVAKTQNNDKNTFGIVIFEAEGECAAQRIMTNDSAVREGVMRATRYPYKIALMRK
jgi:hypothetical protein